MAIKYEVLASTGTYTDKNGNTKNRWQKCGVVMSTKNGGYALKLETVPVGKDFDGWFTLAEPKSTDDKPKGKAASMADMDDDVPF